MFLGGTFNGDMSNNIERQLNLVKTFAEQCCLKPKEIENIKTYDTPVPMVRFYHVPSNLYCNLSFKSGLGVYNS